MTTEFTTAITGAVVHSLEGTADPRLRELLSSLFGIPDPFRHARFDLVREPR